MTVLGLILDFLLVVLLAATVSYCWLLNRRIRIIQDSRGELAQLLAHFDESTSRASESIMALQAASKKIGETIQTRIDKANYAIDDLTYLLERAGKLADQMEAGIAVSRQREKMAQQTPASARKKEPEIPVEPEAEPEIPVKTLSSLQSMLEKITHKSVDKAEKKKADTDKTRSQAEEELLQMLKKGGKF